SSDTIIVGLLSPNRKLFSDNNLQFYEKESTSVQITQILRKLKPAPHEHVLSDGAQIRGTTHTPGMGAHSGDPCDADDEAEREYRQNHHQLSQRKSRTSALGSHRWRSSIWSRPLDH
ncbi:MAG TPA: hypothetical protein VLI39_15645, partial [Sedimentisphaerales bacterium]|nr:hypothetical protein [Sedimentisphaerales bacterium]